LETVVAFALVLVLVGGCDSTDTARPSGSTVTSRPTTVPAVRNDASSLIATAAGASLSVYTTRSDPMPALVLPGVWLLNGDPNARVPQVLGVEASSGGGWLRVLLPTRPNGSLGWVHRSDVRLTRTRYRVRVDLATRGVVVSRGRRTLYRGAVAVGAPATPTPVGHSYVRVLLRSKVPNSVYGPFAFGLSAHSDALSTFSGGDAEIGLHGNNDPASLGHAVSHGCIRMDNATITWLAGHLPLGTPVDITSE
jgi:L,D-transpeptidase catalytic domain